MEAIITIVHFINTKHVLQLTMEVLLLLTPSGVHVCAACGWQVPMHTHARLRPPRPRACVASAEGIHAPFSPSLLRPAWPPSPRPPLPRQPSCSRTAWSRSGRTLPLPRPRAYDPASCLAPCRMRTRVRDTVWLNLSTALSVCSIFCSQTRPLQCHVPCRI